MAAQLAPPGAYVKPHHLAGQETLEHGRTIIRQRPGIRWNDGTTAREQIIDRRVVIGSAPEADLVLGDRAVSRLHAEVEPRDDGLWIKDLGSKNGTFVNGVRVESALLAPGGKLRVGDSVLVATDDAAPTPVEVWTAERFGRMVGRSAPMKELFARLARIAVTDTSVLVHGETGTGKELVARSIHDTSARARHPFVVVDCAALPETLLEAELFGHAKGAFTGAVAARAGAIESAEGGTVFLDEIGELPAAVQPKLLRVLESREVRRLGESAHRTVDVRIVSATHRDLRRMVNAGAFREDLYFRLAVLVVHVPPLRERAEDIPLLVQHLMGGAAPIPDELMTELSARPWLGNVRELRNFVDRVRALGPADALAMREAPSMVSSPAEGDYLSMRVSLRQPYKDIREQFVDYLEREYFQRLLERHGRDVTAASAEAGVDRTYIYRLIKKHAL